MEESSKKAADELAKAAADRIKDLTKQAKDLEEERTAAMSAVGTTSTAFGTFRFSSYTDAEKKAIDKDIAAKLGTIATEIKRLADNPQSIGMSAGGIF